MQQDDLDFFIANQDRLVDEYPGRVLVIRDREVIGVYVSELDAYLDAKTRFEPGTFTIQTCEPGPEAYTVTISSCELLS